MKYVEASQFGGPEVLSVVNKNLNPLRVRIITYIDANMIDSDK